MDLERVAAQGKLRLAPELAAQIVMSANVGVALMLVSRPSTFTDKSTSRRVRDAVHAAVFTPDVSGPDATPSASDAGVGGDEAQLPAAAARLGALVRRSPVPALSTAETALMAEWLDRLSNTPHNP